MALNAGRRPPRVPRFLLAVIWVLFSGITALTLRARRYSRYLSGRAKPLSVLPVCSGFPGSQPPVPQEHMGEPSSAQMLTGEPLPPAPTYSLFSEFS